MPNTNCLEGIRCPACGNQDAFYIESTAVMYVTDDGAESRGDTSWNDDSHAQCATCERSGKLADFRVKPPAVGDDRCKICDWPPATTAAEGCRSG